MPLIPNHIVDSKLDKYTADEKRRIEKDLQALDDLVFRFLSPQIAGLEYLSTAGAPGTKKTTNIEQSYIDNGWKHKYAYVDPDSMRYIMTHTFLADVMESERCEDIKNAYDEADHSIVDVVRVAMKHIETSPAIAADPKVMEEGYDHWREASQYVSERILNKAFDEGYHILHGTTATSPHMAGLYETLKDQGRSIELKIFTSPDHVRWEAVNKRSQEQNDHHVLEGDVLGKGKMFYDRVPIYMDYADKMSFYWASELNQKPVLCFELSSRSPMGHVVNSDAYEAMLQTMHENDVFLSQQVVRYINRMQKAHNNAASSTSGPKPNAPKPPRAG